MRWQLPWSAFEDVVALSGLSLTPPRVPGVVELLLAALEAWAALSVAVVAVGMLVAVGSVGPVNGPIVEGLLPKLVVEAPFAGMRVVSLEPNT